VSRTLLAASMDLKLSEQTPLESYSHVEGRGYGPAPAGGTTGSACWRLLPHQEANYVPQGPVVWVGAIRSSQWPQVYAVSSDSAPITDSICSVSVYTTSVFF
jgi:hypothetical protein